MRELLRDLYRQTLVHGYEHNKHFLRRPSVKRMIEMIDEFDQPVGLYNPGDEMVWLWSDQHLWHKNIIKYCNRPFVDADEMNDKMLGEWASKVGMQDTLICAGDIAMAGSVSKARLDMLRSMPGYKIIVYGNHDLTRKGKLGETGADEGYMALVIPGDPTLLVTHMPLDQTPPHCVNVHGHVHNNIPLDQTRINISVEYTDYAPISLYEIQALAGAMLYDRVPDGDTTVERIRSLKGVR